MKKILTLATVAVFSLITAGCSTSQHTVPSSVESQCDIDGKSAPQWVCSDISEDNGVYLAVGSAAISKSGFSLTRDIAVANARNQLSTQISVTVKSKVESYMRSTGIGESETIDSVTTSVSKQISNNILRGSKVIESWKGKTEYFVLMSIPKDTVMKIAKNAVSSSFHNDNALWQQFQSTQSLEALEKEFK